MGIISSDMPQKVAEKSFFKEGLTLLITQQLKVKFEG